jgi:hypothetical protein
MTADTWEALKSGYIKYLSGREKILLDEWVSNQKEVERKYYARCFKFTIDPDDRERSTYECSCTKTFDEFINKDKVITTEKVANIGVTPEPIQEDVNIAVQAKLETVLAMIQSMEDAMNISVIARGGSYGGARLVVRDNKTGEELVRE